VTKSSGGPPTEEARRNEADKTTMKVRSIHLYEDIQPETSCNAAPEATKAEVHDKPKSQAAKPSGCLRSGRFDIAKTRWASSGGHRTYFRHSVSFEESRNTTRFIEAKTLTRRASTGDRGPDKYYRQSSFSFEKAVESASQNDSKTTRGSPLYGSHRWSVPTEIPLSTTRPKYMKPARWESPSAGHRDMPSRQSSSLSLVTRSMKRADGKPARSRWVA
jgi:hypothetical protein